MRILCISDTHCLHAPYTELIQSINADVLIHAGDVTSIGVPGQLKLFMDWYQQFEHIPHKIFIGGNHDFCLQFQNTYTENLLTQYPTLTLLQNSGVVIGGFSFWGSPYSPAFGNWAFMFQRGEQAKELWKNIPEKTDVLITHGPPYAMLDRVIRNTEPQGCEELAFRVRQIKPRLHVFGHIHESYGEGGNLTVGSTQFVNASLLNEQYQPINMPILIEL